MMSDSFQKYQQGGLQHEPKATITVREEPVPTFAEELQSLINRHSQENDSGTPDFILAQYLTGALDLFNTTVQARANWRGERLDSIFNVAYDEKVRLVVYDKGRRNEIGEAKVEVWPGETAARGKITALIPVFEGDSGA